MTPSFVVLVDLSAAAERAARYAAVLGAPLHVQLELVNVEQDPVLSSELAFAPMPYLPQLQTETEDALQALAHRLPTPAEATVSVAPMHDAVQEAIARHHPLLLVMSLSAEHSLVDYLLRNHLLPVLRATHLPLLLVPEAGPPPSLPRRVLVAVDGEPFAPNTAARRLLPLLAAWSAVYTVTHAVAPGEQQAFAGQRVLGQLRLSKLLPAAAQVELYEQHHLDPAAGVLQALTDTQADLLVLIARPRNFLERRFHRSVTAEVLRRSPVPVLLVPAEAPELPGWMPNMS